MKRTAILMMSAILIFSFSVFAQRLQSRPIPELQLMTVQDDVSGSFLVFEATSGEYKFIRCSDGASLTGFGLVKDDGEFVTIEHIQHDRSLEFACNMKTHEGKGYVETYSLIPLKSDISVMKETIYDSYMGDSSSECVKK